MLALLIDAWVAEEEAGREKNDERFAELFAQFDGDGGGLAELQAHPFFDGVDWAALAAGTAPSPLAALASHQLHELLPDGGDGPPNPELGIETEPCPAELLSADGEAERFDGLS